LAKIRPSSRPTPNPARKINAVQSHLFPAGTTCGALSRIGGDTLGGAAMTGTTACG